MVKESNKGKKKVLNAKERKTSFNKEKNRVDLLSQKLKRFTARNKTTDHVNYKVWYLMHDPFTYINAYAKISKNRGALTKGYEDEKTMKSFGQKSAETIVKKIKSGKFKFKPVKRTWVSKSGKISKRPLNVPTQTDRIVQEAVRGILEVIYEPEFVKQGELTQNLSNNYGFRPNLSTWDAIEKLKTHSKRCNIVVEGDIASAYNNVNHRILMNILRIRIKDKKFLKFIYQMLKSGIMDENRYEHSLTGTLQGGIVLPLLFNIYMLGFDQFIYDGFIASVLEYNKNKRDDNVSKIYSALRRKLKKHAKLVKEMRTLKTGSSLELKKEIKEFKKIRAIRNITPFNDLTNMKKGVVYVRYADDWVLSLTATKQEAEAIKMKISEYLRVKRKMELDDEKIKISWTSEGYKFLGFEIRSGIQKNIKLKKVTMRNNGVWSRPFR